MPLSAPACLLLAAATLVTEPPAPTTEPSPSKQAHQPAANPAAAMPTPAVNAATTATPRTDEGWVKRNESFNARARQGAEQGDIDNIFLGDSITQGWEGAGKPVWDEFYARRHAVNFGIGGDRTEHVLYRVQHGNLDGLAHPKAGHAPRLVVLMIGTNNSNGSDHTAEQIAAGIRADLDAIREKLPETKVLLLSIFPRGEKPNPQRDKNAQASRLAARAADNVKVFHLDLTDRFTQKDGVISKEIMPDALHLSERGYRLWAEGMEPTLKMILGEK